MATIASIINSVPEPLATAILTATFTGLIVFFLQKRIESSFAEKLEKYRADLQKTSIEHQIKFAKIHEKRVQALERLCQEFRNFAASIRKDLAKVGAVHSTYDQAVVDITDIDFHASFQTLAEFRRYFEDTRFLLSDDSINVIYDIYQTSYRTMLVLTSVVSDIFIPQVPKHLAMAAANELIINLQLKMSEISSEKPDIKLLLREAQQEMDRQVIKLEYLYKSVADTIDNTSMRKAT